MLDDDGRCAGILTRTNIARGIRRRVVLVDHNEASQSAAGIEDASVVEIVDHHRVGDIQTAGPILFLNLPVGSTATIVATRYEMLGVEVPPPIAGILLAAVLTDTLLLKSPTTTQLDREVVQRLAAVAEVDPMELGMDLFRSRSAGEEFSAERILRTDVKEYRVGDVVAAIAQYEAVDLGPVMERADDVRAAMNALREQRGYDLVVLMATDVVREGSEIFAVGKTRLIERALGISLAEGSAWLPGVSLAQEAGRRDARRGRWGVGVEQPRGRRAAGCQHHRHCAQRRDQPRQERCVGNGPVVPQHRDPGRGRLLRRRILRCRCRAGVAGSARERHEDAAQLGWSRAVRETSVFARPSHRG